MFFNEFCIFMQIKSQQLPKQAIQENDPDLEYKKQLEAAMRASKENLKFNFKSPQPSHSRMSNFDITKSQSDLKPDNPFDFENEGDSDLSMTQIRKSMNFPSGLSDKLIKEQMQLEQTAKKRNYSRNPKIGDSNK